MYENIYFRTCKIQSLQRLGRGVKFNVRKQIKKHCINTLIGGNGINGEIEKEEARNDIQC